MQALIDAYFESCKPKPLCDADGSLLTDKNGNAVYSRPEVPSCSGLALALGFSSRQSLLNYQENPKFLDTIARAKLRCEKYAESRLYDRDGARGAEFALKYGFKGWGDDDAAGEEVLKKLDEVLGSIGGETKVN